MANVLFDKGRKAFLDGDIDWLNDTIKVLLVDGADYTPLVASHEFLPDVPVIARVATSPALAGKSSTAGVADANDVTFAAVAGDSVEYLVAFQDTGNPATSRLIFIVDTATGLPLIPNGSDVVLVWDNGGSKIFKL